MQTLLIPCLGRSIYDGRPSYLWRCNNGETLLEKILNGIRAERFDRIIFSILAYDEIHYDILDGVSDKYRERIELCVFEQMTTCVAETVYESICLMNVCGALVVKDCDSYFDIDRIEGNAVVGIDVYHNDSDIPNLREKSFLHVNEQGNIIDIIEKHLRTDIISIGGYAFASTDDFKFAYEKLSDNCYDMKRIYISHVIGYLIGMQTAVFKFVPARSYESYGTLAEALFLQEKDKFGLAIFDLDGTLFDTTEVNYRAYKEAMGERGEAFTYDYYCSECNGKNYREFLSLFIEDDDEIEMVHDIKKNLYNKYLKYAVPHRHLLRLIRMMSEEYHISIVTTASKKNAIEILNEHQLMPFIELLIGQEDVKSLKPSPEGFKAAMRYFKMSPQQTLIFEDSSSGLIAAQKSCADYLKVFNYN